jgi:hypothetical protein
MRMIHVGKFVLLFAFLIVGSVLLAPTTAKAQDTLVSGRVLLTEGHEAPACRRLQLRTESGNDMWFRLPNTGADNSILAVALTALAGSRKVQLAYNPSLLSGCGTEPRILYISILAD